MTFIMLTFISSGLIGYVNCDKIALVTQNITESVIKIHDDPNLYKVIERAVEIIEVCKK